MRDTARHREAVQALWYWLPVVFYAGVIFLLSSLSHPEEELPSFLLQDVSDKILHAVEYGILSFLCYRALRWATGPAAARHAVLLAMVTASFYGLTDEVHQAFVPFRDASWQDWLADTVGAALAAVGVGRMTKTNASA
ncbi:MAG: VanZ family protein [Nitrospirae bacterium]|nr:VanZ family protein [Nitrospirota bacterium]